MSFHPNGNYLVSGSQDGSIKVFDLLEARPIYDVLGHKDSVTCVKFSSKGNFFASGSEDKSVYIWKTNFDEVDEMLGIGKEKNKNLSKKDIKYSIENCENAEEQNDENEDILTERTNKMSLQSENSSGNTASELVKLNSKMDMIMKTLVLMDKRLTLVEDQLRNSESVGEK